MKETSFESLFKVDIENNEILNDRKYVVLERLYVIMIWWSKMKLFIKKVKTLITFF